MKPKAKTRVPKKSASPKIQPRYTLRELLLLKASMRESAERLAEMTKPSSLKQRKSRFYPTASRRGGRRGARIAAHGGYAQTDPRRYRCFHCTHVTIGTFPGARCVRCDAVNTTKRVSS